MKFYEIAGKGLRDKLGCVLFQFPPSFSYSQERLKAVIANLDTQFTNVVEFRHDGWWRQDVMEKLAEHNITFCSVDYPKLPNEIVKTSPTGYIRMHGNPKLFYSEYSPQQLEDLHANVIRQNFRQVYIYFNNTASTAGIINALQVKKLNGESGHHEKDNL